VYAERPIADRKGVVASALILRREIVEIFPSTGRVRTVYTRGICDARR